MEIKLAIGLPTNRGVKPKCAESILQMVNHSNLDYHFIVSTYGYNTAENRNYITAQAVKNNCTHLLLLDDDMLYEADSIDKLLAHKKHIVGATYSVRRLLEPDQNNLVIEFFTDDEGKPLKSDTEPFKCSALGGGLLLIDLKSIRDLEPPFFWYKANMSVGMVTMSNDWWFCEKARNAGWNIWCDPSLLPKHIGDYEF